ncbi:MAG: tRNA (N(6)-L-threonylcarbamoyladenosine(37)-C(2))-methylthiotransferase [Candidatus Diapherotrites archaeon]|nr:tRNA (N(6)-L-threonylcarbamoyladenosine(37)-C(2))-methylthiotransferase [Candidatus Diapherotrites archaeon]
MKVFVKTFGCAMNKADSDLLRTYISAEHEVVSDECKADAVVINTCAVKTQTENAMIRQIKVLSSSGKPFVVAGCLPKINMPRIRDVCPHAACVDTKSMEKINRALDSAVNRSPAFFSGEKRTQMIPTDNKARESKVIAVISIAEGCLSACSYCGTRLARGKLQSFSQAHIEREFDNALKNGFKEFWLTAQDTSAFGADCGTSLDALLSGLLSRQGEFRIRIGMMNPKHLFPILDGVVEALKNDNMYKFLHLPVQSGSDSVLKDMNRGYSRDEYFGLVKELRSKIKDLTLSTDIIVGFPNETGSDFEDTLDLLNQVKPDITNISRFGVRPNTTAAEMPQLHDQVKKDRSRVVSKLCADLSFENNKKMVGKVQRSLVSGLGRKGNFEARTQNYKPAILTEAALGEFVDLKVKKAHRTYLDAELV